MMLSEDSAETDAENVETKTLIAEMLEVENPTQLAELWARLARCSRRLGR